MNKIVIVGLFLSVAVVSCSQGEQSQTKDNKHLEGSQPISTTEVKTSDEKRATKQDLLKKVERLATVRPSTMSINGEKFKFSGDKLSKGSEVYNFNLSEKGTVKGTLVVVLKSGELLDEANNNPVRIAKDTFRLTPEDTVDLISIYHELLSNSAIEVVELEIDYSGKVDDVESY